MTVHSWSQLPLRDVLAPAGQKIDLEADQTYAQITVRLWGKGLTLRGRAKGAEIAAPQQNRVRAGQFLLSKIDARHGAFGLVPPELDGAVVSNDFPVFDVNATVALPSYVEWVSKTAWFVRLCKKASEGSTNRVRLKEDRFLRQAIPVPPIEEQHRIVAKLDAAAAIVANHSKSAEGVEGEIGALLARVFNEITADAPRVAMGRIAPLVRRRIEVDLDENYAELGVRSFGRGTFHKPALAGADVGSKKLFRIHGGDLLFNIVFAWEGAVAVAQPNDEGRVGSHRFLTCVPDPRRATADFIRFWFLTKEGLQSLGQASPGGAGRNRTLGVKSLEAIRVPVPSLDAQLWFDHLQARTNAARDAQGNAARELAKLIPAILNEAFTSPEF